MAKKSLARSKISASTQQYIDIAEIKESRFDRTGRGNFGRRFDDTNAEQHGDGRVSEPPLCWVCLFVRTGRRL